MKQSHMAREIAEQAELLRRLAPTWWDAAAQARSVIGTRANLVLIGRGSSRNACTFLSYLYGLKSGRQAIELRPWITLQRTPAASWEDATVFAFSASGENTDVAHAARILRQAGACVLAITSSSDPESGIARHADSVLCLQTGPERAGHATKSFGAQLFVSAALCGFELSSTHLETAKAIDCVLDEEIAEQLARFLLEGRSAVWVARGPAVAAAQDAALKIQETVGLPSTAWSAAEFLHGPLRAMTPDDRVVLLDDASEPMESVGAIASALLAHGTPFVTLGGMTPRRHAWPPAVPYPSARWARTVVLAVIGQLVALRCAVDRGLNPDLPFGRQGSLAG